MISGKHEDNMAEGEISKRLYNFLKIIFIYLYDVIEGNSLILFVHL